MKLDKDIQYFFTYKTLEEHIELEELLYEMDVSEVKILSKNGAFAREGYFRYRGTEFKGYGQSVYSNGSYRNGNIVWSVKELKQRMTLVPEELFLL